MREAVSVRRGISFYHDKSEAEFREDVYERYDALVTRQMALHLADELHGAYPFQPLLDYLIRWLPTGEHLWACDVGCSVGRLAAEVAAHRPSWKVSGIDLSYQMLRQANDFWIKEIDVTPNLLKYGWGSPRLTTSYPARLDNSAAAPISHRLDFSLAKAEDLPFDDERLGLVLNTFLIDRVGDPSAVFAEFARVLRPGGRLITVTPLNFLSAAGWRDTFPAVKILQRLRSEGWTILDWTDPLVLDEPMDARGNAVRWACVAFVAERS